MSLNKKFYVHFLSKYKNEIFGSHAFVATRVYRFKLIKLFTLVVLVFISPILLIPIMVMLFLLTLVSFQGPI